MLKKLMMVVLAALLVFGCTSCKLTVSDEQKDLEQVVAIVNGVEITKGEVMAAYNTYRYYYNLTDENQNTEAYIDTRNSLLENVYATMIEYHLILQYAGEYTSVELTDDMKKAIEEEKQGIIDSIEGGADTVVEELLHHDPDLDREFVKESRIAERLAYRGITTGEYQMTREYESIISSVREALAAEYEPSDKAIEEYYETYVSTQQTYLEGDLSYYDYYASESLNLYMPAGFRYVKNLLIAIPEDKFNEINELRIAGKDEEADALRDAELEKLQERAGMVYEKLQNGANYEEMLAQYGEDPGMKEGAANAETGYRLYAGTSTLEPNFLAGALALQKPGDISKPIGSDYGYYIIKFESESEAHAYPLEEVWDGIRDVLIAQRSSEYYEEMYENWKRQAEIVEFKENLY